MAEIKPRPLWWRSCALTNPLQLYKLYINCIKFKYAFLDILDEETNLNCVSQGSCIPVFFFLYHSLDTCFFTLIVCVHESWLTKNKNIWGKIGESSSKLIIFLDSKLRSHGIRLNSLHFWGSRIQSQVEFHESLVTTNFWVVLYMYFKSWLSLSLFFYLSYNTATILISRLTENGAIGPI